MHQKECVSISSYNLYPLFIALPHNFCQLPFSPPLPPDRAATPGLGGHVKAYNRVAPRPPNEAGLTTTTTCPAVSNLYANHRGSHHSLCLRPCPRTRCQKRVILSSAEGQRMWQQGGVGMMMEITTTKYDPNDAPPPDRRFCFHFCLPRT